MIYYLWKFTITEWYEIPTNPKYTVISKDVDLYATVHSERDCVEYSRIMFFSMPVKTFNAVVGPITKTNPRMQLDSAKNLVLTAGNRVIISGQTWRDTSLLTTQDMECITHVIMQHDPGLRIAQNVEGNSMATSRKASALRLCTLAV